MTTLHSVLDQAGPQAAHIARLWWVMLAVCTVVFTVVMAALAAAVVRGRRSHAPAIETPVDSRLHVVIGAAVTATIVVLFGLLIASFITQRAVESLHASSAVTIDVTGHQWWWEAQYEDALPSRRVTTANEIHIPVGRPIVLKLTSRDVIHSFWVPSLDGKRDLIPGYTTAIWMQADRPGVYRGQCAEFCGRQHAKMAIFVTAESEDLFERWLASQRGAAREPDTALERRGQQVFLASSCALCHTVRGTSAAATVGPDLTHIASRGSLAAGTLANTRLHLASWIEDPHVSKPLNQMPPNSLAGDDLQALVAYLESLR
jgi:cytochrome c oxidase subunit II